MSPEIPSAEGQVAARHLSASFAGDPVVAVHTDEALGKTVHVLRWTDEPKQGLSTYATVDLSENLPIPGLTLRSPRVELLGTCANAFEAFSGMLATCAFTILRERLVVGAGTVLPNVVNRFGLDVPMRHIALMPPLFWERLERLHFDDRPVSWLVAAPISDAEYWYAMHAGFEALEDRFAEEEVDLFDLYRASCVE